MDRASVPRGTPKESNLSLGKGRRAQWLNDQINHLGCTMRYRNKRRAWFRLPYFENDPKVGDPL